MFNFNKLLNLKWIFILFFSVVICQLSFVPHAFAQSDISPLDITVSPPVFDLTAKPGDIINEVFRLRNNQSTPIPFKIEARRLVSNPTTGAPEPANDTKGEELSWVKFDPGSFTAQPREWSDVKFSIDIPDSAAFGYYYVFRLIPQNTVKQKNTGTAVQGEVLIVVLLNVKKDGAISQAKLVSFNAADFISQYLPINFNVTLENSGNVHVKPHGNIFISRGGKDEIASIDVNGANGSILPGGKRTFLALWNDGFITNDVVRDANGTIKTDKNGRQAYQLTINWNKLTSLRIGPYTAHLLMVYDDGKRDQTIEAETKFWVIPYIPIAVAVIIFIVIIFLIKTILNSYIKTQIRRGEKK